MTEGQVQAEICEFLADRRLFFWRTTAVPVYGRALPKYALKGLPDIFIVNGYHFIALEIKRPEGDENMREPNGRKQRKGMLSPDQANFCMRFEANGGKYFCVRSLSEALKEIEPFI